MRLSIIVCVYLGIIVGFISSSISKERLIFYVPSFFFLYVVLASHLVVQIEVVKLSVGPEVLSVTVQGEVDIPPVAFDHHRVPVIVIQEAAGGHRGMPQDRSILITACR